MDNNQKDLTPQELLKKLKESLLEQKENGSQEAPELHFDTEPMAPVSDVGLEVSEELSDEEILRAQAEPAVVSATEEETVPVIRYRFRVRRPESATPAGEEEPLPVTEELLPEADTEIAFEAGDVPDVSALMDGMLSEEEVAALQRIGNMPDAEAIALEARAEAEAAYEAGENAVRIPAEQIAQETVDLSLTDEVEAIYEGAAEYYESIDETLQSEQGAEASENGIIHPDGSITPDENSRLNAMNFITSLTKKAAQTAAAEAAAMTAGAVTAANASAEGIALAAEVSDVTGAESAPAGMEESAPVGENTPPAEESVPADFDEVDVNLMLAFGMEEELKDALGEEETEKITAQADEDAKSITSTDLFKVVTEEEAVEFTDFTQTKEIFARLKRRYRKALFSLGGGILIAILLFFFENVPAMGGSLPQAFDKGIYPVVNLMTGLQLIVFAYALVLDQVKRGIVSLIGGKWIPETGTALVVVLSFLYQLLMVLFCRASYTTYNFPVALCILLALAYDFMNLKREIYSFNVVASKKVKYALCTLPYEESERERDAFRPYYEVPGEEEAENGEEEALPQEDLLADKPMYQLKRGAFADGFFARMGRYPAYKAVLRLLIPAVAALSLFFLVVGAIRAGSFSYGVSMGYLTLVLCAPMSMFVTYSYPLYKASRNAFRTDSAIIGEAAAEEYLDAEVITFEDKDIFPAKGVKVKSIKVYGTHRIDRVVFNAANVFRKYGGPLSQVFNMAALELGTTDEVYFGVIEEDGIEAMVGGSHIYMGKTDYLRRKGYEPGFDDEDEVIEGNGGICVMFMAIEDEVAAKFYIEYTVDAEFESILRAMYSSGVCIGVRTYDPNIDDRMLQLLLRHGEYPVRAIKCRTEQSPNLAREHLDSGIVSRRSVKDMLRAFMSCDRVLRSVKLGTIIKMAGMAVGAVISLILLIMAVSGVASFWAALYQLFWLIPLIVYAKLSV